MIDPRKLALIDTNLPLPVLEVLLPQIDPLLHEAVDVNYAAERIIQLLRLEKADFFYRGIQNIAPSFDGYGNVQWIQYGGNGAPLTGNQGQNERWADYNPRITKSYGDKYTSVLGERPFYNTTAEAVNPKNPQDRAAARQVNLLLQMLHSQWDVKELNHRMAYSCFKTGTTLTYVRPVTDGERYGFDMVPQFHLVEVPHPFIPGQTLQVPQRTSVQTPRTSVEPTLLNGFTTTWPFNVVELEQTPFLKTTIQMDWGTLLEGFPGARELVGESGGWSGGTEPADTQAMLTQQSSQSQTGVIRYKNTNLRTYEQIWLPTSQIQLIKDEGARAQALSAVTEGLRIIKIEGSIVGVYNLDFKKRFAACPPGMADYLFADGASWGIFGLEDATSNLLNIAMQFMETGIPTYLVNKRYVNADSLNRMRYSPNRTLEVLPMAGDNLDQAFRTLDRSNVPEELITLFPVIQNFVEQFLGLFPQVYGQGAPNQTLGEARMQLTQGLLQLSTVGILMSKCWEQTDTNAVKLYCEVVKTNPQHQGHEIDLDLIRNGQWAIKGQTTMPRSYAERKESLQNMISQYPDLVKAMGVTDPVNFPVLVDYCDLPDLESTPSKMVEALGAIMDQLWEGSPSQVPGPPAQPGQPPSPPQTKSSVPFDGLLYDPKLAVSVAQSSLVDRIVTGGSEVAQTPGGLNVRAFLQDASDALKAQAMVQPDPPRLSFNLAVDKTPPDQEAAILQKYGINVGSGPSAPSMHTINTILGDEVKHQQGMEKLAVQGQQKKEQGPPALMPPGSPTMDLGQGPLQ